MNLTDVIVPVVTAILSIGTVSAFVARYVTKISKYIRLAADAINTLNNVSTALEDGQLTVPEMDQLKKDIEKFKIDLKS